MMKTMIFFAALLLLGACTGLTSTQAAPTIYALHPAVLPAGEEMPTGAPSGILQIPEPGVPAGFDTSQIALYLQDGRRLDYYAGAQWPASLGHSLQDVLIQAGRNALPQMIVDTPDLNIPAHFRLMVKVIDFSPHYQSGAEQIPQLRAAMTFTLISLPEESVIADFTMESGQMARANSLSSVTAGLESLLQEILRQAYDRVSAALTAYQSGNAI